MAGPGSHSTLSSPAWTPHPHPSGYAVCSQENVNPFPKGLKGLPANQLRQRPNPGVWLLSCRTPDLPRHCPPSPDPPLHIGTEAFSTVPNPMLSSSTPTGGFSLPLGCQHSFQRPWPWGAVFAPVSSWEPPHLPRSLCPILRVLA